MTKSITICAVAVLVLFVVNFANADDWSTLNMPGADNTYALGIDGNTVVGFHNSAADGYITHGFAYNRNDESWIGLDYPGVAGAGTGTQIIDVDGNSIVGYCWDSSNAHGVIYNNADANWTVLDYPGATYTYVTGISGDSIVGGYNDESGNEVGFVYNKNNNSYIPFNLPDATYTIPYAIDGNNIVGIYQDSSCNWHGFIYDGVESTNLDLPGVSVMQPCGISGDNVVGYYVDDDFIDYGFCYNITDESWTLLNMPGACDTFPNGIDGVIIVGYFGDPEGFIYTIPEPATLTLLSFGVLVLHRRKNK